MEIQLPLSGTSLRLRPPNGFDEMFLVESGGGGRRAAVEFLSRIAGGADLSALPVYDFETLLLELRALLVGEAVVAEARCGCGERVDVRFTVRDYLAYKQPRPVTRTAPAGPAGWLLLSGTEVVFRLPTVADQLALSGRPEPWRSLAESCVRPAAMARRVDGLLRALAPPLSDVVTGTCPHCGRTAPFGFDVPAFVLAELRADSLHVDEDVHLLASAYGWSEEHILGLPRARRARYAEMIRADRGSRRA